MQAFKSIIRAYWQLGWLRISLITSMVFGLILLLMPLLLQWSLGQLLKDRGASEVAMENVDFNPFAGTLLLEQLQISGADGPPASIEALALDMDMLDLFSGRLVLDKIILSGVTAVVTRDAEDQIDINGIPLYPAPTSEPAQATEETTGPIAFGVNRLQFEKLQFSYQEPEFAQQANIHSLQLQNLQSWNPAQPALVAVEMTLNQAPLALTSEMTLFAEAPRISGQLSLKALSFAPYAKFYQAYLDGLQGEINLDTQFDITIGNGIAADIEHNISIKHLQVDYQHITHQTQSLDWQGRGRYSADGKIDVRGNLEIHDSIALDRKLDYQLYAVERLAVTDFNQDQQQSSFDQLAIDQLSMIRQSEDKTFVEIKQLELDELSYSIDTASLHLQRIDIKRPSVALTIDKQKRLAQLEPLLSTLNGLTAISEKPDAAAVEEPSATANQPVSIVISELNLVEPGSLAITDNSVTPSYQSRIDLARIELTNISSAERAQFSLAFNQGEYTRLTIDGEGLLLEPSQDLALTAEITQLDLPPVTAYTSHSMGYGMKSGTIDSRIDFKINQREIDSQIDLTIDSIEVIETEKATAEEITSAAGMSIDLALSTLKDKNNVIELRLPIKGNIDEPDFDLSHILRKATGKAMQSASLAYLKHTLQPFGSLVTLFKLAKAAADQIALPPVTFAANSTELQAQQQELLDKVVNLLQERPGLKIKACAVSALEDQQAIKAMLLEQQQEALKQQGKEAGDIQLDETRIQTQMRELANARSAGVKAYILQQGQLEPGRVLNCLSATDTEGDASPSVQLLI
ncbi:MAG: DUF748 domain-containing protein [Gammaproteobacteria bacterium]|nr:DUF748 domain-containing protein [Gammaproteobacteria bacterium]